MKKNFLKAIGGAMLIILMTALVAQVWVSAQDSNVGAEQNTKLPDGNGQENGLEGVWNTQLTVRNCQTGAAIRTFPAMKSFIRGGIVQETGSGSSPALRTPGHGVWVYQSGQRYITTLQYFRFAVDGTYIGTQKFVKYIDLGYESYNATVFVDLFDANGNSTGTGCATETAMRFN